MFGTLIVTISPWSPLTADHQQQLLDVLHVSHMWDILPGVNFASNQLRQQFDLSPCHLLNLAGRYGLTEWVNGAVTTLLTTQLRVSSIYVIDDLFSKLLKQTLTSTDKRLLGFELYSIIACAKESISHERQRLGNHPPFPRNFDDGPYCSPTQHMACKRIWTEKWFLMIVRRIHGLDPLPLIEIPDALEAMEHKGMNIGCKNFILTWLRASDHIRREEVIIGETVSCIIDILSA